MTEPAELLKGIRVRYARISTRAQDHAAQVELLNAADCREIVEETISTRRKDRPKLQAALASLKAGDTLVVTKPDRVERFSAPSSQRPVTEPRIAGCGGLGLPHPAVVGLSVLGAWVCWWQWHRSDLLDLDHDGGGTVRLTQGGQVALDPAAQQQPSKAHHPCEHARIVTQERDRNYDACEYGECPEECHSRQKRTTQRQGASGTADAYRARDPGPQRLARERRCSGVAGALRYGSHARPSTNHPADQRPRCPGRAAPRRSRRAVLRRRRLRPPPSSPECWPSLFPSRSGRSDRLTLPSGTGDQVAHWTEYFAYYSEHWLLCRWM
ncbi:recombinase family protein [Nonomuraea sp. NPDC049625]|uniref:recombinase family protein n=1 Tax=Nonomuraea sp. NPDC049625 TaxID=3155775 RepID=UPI00341304B7